MDKVGAFTTEAAGLDFAYGLFTGMYFATFVGTVLTDDWLICVVVRLLGVCANGFRFVYGLKTAGRGVVLAFAYGLILLVYIDDDEDESLTNLLLPPSLLLL